MNPTVIEAAAKAIARAYARAGHSATSSYLNSLCAKAAIEAADAVRLYKRLHLAAVPRLTDRIRTHAEQARQE